MSDISVNVTSAGAANVAVSNGSAVTATVGNGGAVNVALGTISPGNATVVAGTVVVNSTQTLSAGASAFVKNAGSVYAAKLDFGIPAGQSTTVSVGNTTTLAAGSNATVTGTTNGSTLTLAFGIPAGASGSNGINGTNGLNGITPSFSVGTVTTGSPGSSATVTATSSNSGANVLLDFTIPRGADGSNGSGSGNHNYVTGLNNLTGNITLAAGANVTLTSNGSTLTISASGGGDADGGDYVGVPFFGINITSQPQSQTASSNLTIGSWSNTTFGNLATVSSLSSGGGNLAAFSAFGASVGGAVSSDGATWTSGSVSASAFAPANSTATASGLAWDGSRWVGRADWFDGSASFAARAVAVSQNGTVSILSEIPVYWNAITWFLKPRDIAYGNGAYVAIDEQYAYGSTDGVNWSSGSTHGPGFGLMRARLAYFSGAFYVSGAVFQVNNLGAVYYSHYALYRSTNNGETWTQQKLEETSSASVSIAASGTTIVSLRSTTTAYVSTDGTTWTTVTLPRSSISVTWTGSQFVAFGESTASQYITSPDGITWTVATGLQAGGISRAWRAAAATSSAIVATYDANLYDGLDNLSSTGVVASLTSSGKSATFSVSGNVTGGGSISYQWQVSSDAGSTWTNVSGGTSSTLALTGLTTGDSGKRYRVGLSATGAETVYSTAATLTVTG